MNWKKFIPIFLILALMIAAYFSGITQYLTFDNLKAQRETLLNTVSSYPILSPLIFISLYTLMIALSLPGGALLSILAGFLFPFPVGLLSVLVGATIGASLIFLSAKTALGELLKRKARPLIQKMEKGFQENAVSYLFFLRLVPLFPFWLVNLAPAFFGVRLWTFVWTTFLGIIPGSFVFTQAGRGLGAIFDSGEAFSVNAIFNTQMKIALLAAGIFALLPILIKKLRKKRDRQ